MRINSYYLSLPILYPTGVYDAFHTFLTLPKLKELSNVNKKKMLITCKCNTCISTYVMNVNHILFLYEVITLLWTRGPVVRTFSIRP